MYISQQIFVNNEKKKHTIFRNMALVLFRASFNQEVGFDPNRLLKTRFQKGLMAQDASRLDVSELGNFCSQS